MALYRKQNYEVTKEFKLKDSNGKPTKVSIVVRSDKCADAKDINTGIAASAISLQLSQGEVGNNDAVIRWMNDQKELQIDRIFACTVSIDWNGEEWEEGDGGPKLTRDNLAKMLAEDWVADQFSEAIKSVGDFTKP